VIGQSGVENSKCVLVLTPYSQFTEFVACAVAANALSMVTNGWRHHW